MRRGSGFEKVVKEVEEELKEEMEEMEEVVEFRSWRLIGPIL